MVKWSDFEDADEALASHCRAYCERPLDASTPRWIDDPRCYARTSLPDLKASKPKKPKKKSWYKNKKKRATAK